MVLKGDSVIFEHYYGGHTPQTVSNSFSAAKTVVGLLIAIAVEEGMITYRGLPAPVICDFLSREASKAHYAEGTSFHIGKIEMVANTGTYIDCPFHRYADGKDLSEVALERFADLDALVVHVPFAQTLAAAGVELISTGGTAKLLAERGLQEGATQTATRIEPAMIESAASAMQLLRLRPKRFRWFGTNPR